MKQLSYLLFTALSLVFIPKALAHSEHDKARFVAQTGSDEGRCDQVLRPCRTIAFAVSQANKGDSILVAAGVYDISTEDELFLLKSELVPILGGYNHFDHFQSQSPNINITSLTNIPSDMAEPLRQQGFKVLVDGKSSSKNKNLQEKYSRYLSMDKKQSNLACGGGIAGTFDCENIDLLAHMPLSEFSTKPNAANDIWGHVDLNNGNEYALIGLRNGVAVVNVTDPENPIEVGTVKGEWSTWRDVKVYQYFDDQQHRWMAYAYATTEATDDVTIIDLNTLPNTVSLAEKNTAVNTAHNVYITNVDHTLNIALANETPSLQLVGTNSRYGVFQSYSLATPSTLTSLTGQYYGSGYTHDGSSITIKDSRIADCQNTNSSCTVFIDFNEKEMKLWDVTNPEKSIQLGIAEYDDVPKGDQYIHSGWSTEDKMYVLVHDELDEKYAGINSTVRVFSIANLANPVQVGQWVGSTKAIDHNGFVRGNRYYISNYQRGLTVLDITDPSAPTEIGFFDTFTPSNNAEFTGAWGVYPFLPSGNILISDVNSGLYILKDNTKQSDEGQLGFITKQINASQGMTLSIPVNRKSSINNAEVEIGYELIPGSATPDSDYTDIQGTLTWSNGETTDKFIYLDISDDMTNDEFKEEFFVRLFNPTNGATLGEHSYIAVKIAGKEPSSTASFQSNAITFAENQSEATVDVFRNVNTIRNITYQYQFISDSAIVGEDVENITGEISWQDGDNSLKSISIPLINDNDSESNESLTLQLTSANGDSLGQYSSITINIADDENNQSPIISLSENFQVNTNQTVSLTAQVNDPENDDMTYLWQQTSGASVNINNSTTKNATFVSPASAGTIEISFTATDFRGASTPSNVTITVVAPQTTNTSDSSSSGGGTINLWLISMLLLFTRIKLIKSIH